MKLFRERELFDFINDKQNALQQEVMSEDHNRLLNMNETEYVEYLVQKYRIDPLVFDWDGKSVSSREEMVRAGDGERYCHMVVTYHIPCSGDEDLLECRPSSGLLWTARVDTENGSVCFDIVDRHNDAGRIKREAEGTLRPMREQAANITRQVEQEHNSKLEEYARRVVAGRKEALLRQADLLQSLGVPVRKAQDVPETFAVPVTRKPVVVKPSAPDTAYTPEPALDEPTYQGILGVTHEMGVAMERLPGVYRGRDEETLRDYFLVNLSPHFQSATGETFNKSGKTDILIRHEKANVFVAECTFWQGLKAFLAKIDQALGYLTWRDSKAAILCFVKNKEVAPVLEQIEQKTGAHPCFVKHHGKMADSWFAFEFRLPDDPTRSVHLAVQCFHFPDA